MKKYFFSHKKEFFSFLIISIIYALLVSCTGFVFKALTDAAIGTNFNTFLIVSALSILFFLLDTYFDYAPRFAKAKLANSILYTLRSDLVKHYLNKDLHTVMVENPTDRTNRLVNQLDVIENSYIKPILSAIISILIFTFSLIGSFYLQSTLTIIMLILCFLPFLSPVINQKVLSNKKQTSQEKKKQYLSFFEDFSRNIATVRLTNSINNISNLLSIRSRDTQEHSNNFEKAQAQTYAISYGLSNIIYSGTWIIGGIFVFYKKLSIPGLIAMTTLMGTVAGPIQTLNGLIIDIFSSKKIVNEFLNEIDNNNSKPTNSSETMLEDKIYDISLSNVEYSFKNKNILKNINFSFLENKKYAIIGDSGAGKSSLLLLIAGILTPKKGNLFINALNQQEINDSFFYNHIAFVQQSPELFEATIAQNITLFENHENINIPKIMNLLTEVGLDDWIAHQEEGINTIISTQKSLSGGEAKRLDIARALYRNSEVVLMDEPTSGLDIKNENLITDVIDSIQDKIVIVVTHSHNQKFLKSFDYIIKLENNTLNDISEDYI